MKTSRIVIASFCFFLQSCDGGNVEIFAPDISTKAATEVTDTQAKLNGTLIKLGNSAITSIGFEFSSDPTTLANEQGERIEVSVNANSIPFDISHTVTGLNPATEYYFRAYASLPEVEGLGDILSFTTK